MKEQSFDVLLLKTAFSCMACDGHIDDRELGLILELDEEKKVFGEIDVQKELNKFISQINDDFEVFLRSYLANLKKLSFSDKEQIALLRTAVDVIRSDNELDYKEIKFFKIIRSKLSVSDEQILSELSGIEEFLEKDIITDSYIDRLKEDYFSQTEVPEFKKISSFKEDN
ncbi:MAG: hypothetical protein ACQETL_18840 [Bacteroidota bacterium]